MNLLTRKQVAAKLACNDSFVWKLTKRDKTFPQPVQIGMGSVETARATRWVAEEVDLWIMKKQKESTNDNTEDGRAGAAVHPAQGQEVPA